MVTNSLKISRIALLTVLALLTSPDSVRAQTGAGGAPEALALIEDTAHSICQSIPLSGQGKTLELSGAAEAELSAVARVFAAGNIAGSAVAATEEYEGVLREDLRELIVNANDCRFKVFNVLLARLLPGAPDAVEFQRERAVEAVMDPYRHSWKCNIKIRGDDGGTIASGELTFDPVTNGPKISSAHLAFDALRTRRLEREIRFSEAQWTMGYFGECPDGECLSFISKIGNEPVFMFNNTYHESKGEIGIDGGVMIKDGGKHIRLGVARGFCRPDLD